MTADIPRWTVRVVVDRAASDEAAAELSARLWQVCVRADVDETEVLADVETVSSREALASVVDVVMGLTGVPPVEASARLASRVASGLFGPGIFGTGIDLSALDEETAWRLSQWQAEQVAAAEKRGHDRGVADAYKDVDRLAREIAGAKAVRELADEGPKSYLLWDNERSMWWKANGQGYTHSVVQAGLYSRDEAVKWALQGALGGLSHATVIVADSAS